MKDTQFDLWLEFEHWQPEADDDPEDDFFNMALRLPDGRAYALNVWTFRFLERARLDDQQSGEALNGKYLLPPDLFVERLDRKLMEEIATDLIKRGQLLDDWLIPADADEDEIAVS